jgi:O-antigen chain-terminating methyltransferase
MADMNRTHADGRTRLDELPQWRALAAHREALGEGRVLHLGAGSGWALETLGPRAEGVESDPELAAAAAAEGRPVRHADPVAYLGALAPDSLDGVLVTGLVERLDGGGIAALAAAAARTLAPGGLIVVEGLDPEAAREPDFWRDPDRLRPVHPDTVRMLLEGAGLGEVVVTTDGASTGGPPRYAVHARR